MGIHAILMWVIVGGIGAAAGTFFNLWIQAIALLIFIYWLSTETGGLDTIFPSIIGFIFFIGIAVGDVSYFFQTDKHKTVEMCNPFVVTNIEYDKSKLPDNISQEEFIKKAVKQALKQIEAERDIKLTKSEIQGINNQFKKQAEIKKQALNKLSSVEKQALGL